MAVPRKLMNNGLEIPAFGLGTWNNFGGEPGEIQAAVETAIDAGYRHLDCAFLYSNEDEIGAALAKKFAEGKIKRQDIFVTSKIWATEMRKDLVEAALKKSLKNLGLEYLDLYLIHWPTALKEGGSLFPKEADGKFAYSSTDYLDTWSAMERCVESRLTKSIGVCNFNIQQLQRLLNNCRIKPVMNQYEAHPYLTQTSLKDFCNKNNILVTAYSPLGGKPGSDGPVLIKDPVVLDIANKYGKNAGQILMRYHIDIGNIVIPKSSAESRIKSNIDIFDFALSSDDISRLNNLNRNHRFLEFPQLADHPFYPFN